MQRCPIGKLRPSKEEDVQKRLILTCKNAQIIFQAEIWPFPSYQWGKHKHVVEQDTTCNGNKTYVGFMNLAAHWGVKIGRRRRQAGRYVDTLGGGCVGIGLRLGLCRDRVGLEEGCVRPQQGKEWGRIQYSWYWANGGGEYSENWNPVKCYSMP